MSAQRREQRRVRANHPLVRLAIGAALLALPALAGTALGETALGETEQADGFRLTPSVSWSQGDHRFDLHFGSRFRWERWEALTNKDDNFYAVRTRIGADYTWKDRIRLFAEGQHTHIFDLDSSASGAAALYRSNAHKAGANSVDGLAVRQLLAEARLDSDNWFRIGRQDLSDGKSIRYEEANWTYLKHGRLAERLIGGVGWTHGERSFDGLSMRMEQEGHVLHLMVAEPTTGVFEIDRMYKRQKDVIFGEMEWTVERGTWLDNTELNGFFNGYVDDRDAGKVIPPYFGKIAVYTLGLSLLGIYPVGPGNIDVIAWGAFQFGRYHDSIPGNSAMPTSVLKQKQLAGAFIGEVGYQLPDVWAKPWLRTGVNFATGDSNENNNDRHTFFNIMPTNHPYYGYADQLAFSNLIDLFVQLKLAPLDKLGVEVAFHQFWLYTDNDYRYFGSGVYAKDSLGYGRSVSNGSNNVGQEIDFVVSYAVNKRLRLMGGLAHLFGGKVLSSFSDENVDWAFCEVALSY